MTIEICSFKYLIEKKIKKKQARFHLKKKLECKNGTRMCN